MDCKLREQGFEQGSCNVFDFTTGREQTACESTLKYERGIPYRLINSIFLSRPEHYLSVYQSGCNLSCKKCHSWQFTQNAVGEWMSPQDIAKEVERYMNEYEIVWVLLETNGYGLTPTNLDLFQQAGIDSFWLDIKAYDEEVHRKLTGVSNSRILKLPAEIKDRDFVFEVLSLYIPGWVETDQIGKIASELAAVDAEIPFTILAFFPAYKMSEVPSPDLWQMIDAYTVAKDAGLRKIKLGNVHLFVKTREEYETLEKIGGHESF